MRLNALHKQIFAVSCAAALFGGTWPQLCLAQNKVLKGNVTETGRVQSGPTLSRTQDVKRGADPFSGKSDPLGDALDVPLNDFEPAAPVRPPKAVRRAPLSGNVMDEGNAMPPMTAAPPVYAPPGDMGGDQEPMSNQQQPMPAQTVTTNPNDPDSSPEMQLAWDMWHKRVAQTIFERFNFFAKAAFKFSPPLMARLSYVVSRDGHISNINLDQKSTNLLFNILIVQCVKSLDGDANTLMFPQGSRRMMVQKYGTFAQNQGGQVGFRYQTGDHERIPGR